MTWSRSTLLAVLQQAEYDLPLFQSWIQGIRPDPLPPQWQEHLEQAHPERRTAKLKLIDRISRIIPASLDRRLAVATTVVHLIETMIRPLLLTRAQRKLRQLQKNGLTVIAIAGSFGKTSTKESVVHILSTQWHTLGTPASYNTPLGIAQTILTHLAPDHRFLVVELGEYQLGDIDTLLQLVRPDAAILTPVGFAHQERFGSERAMQKTFEELLTSAAAPPILFVHDANQSWFPAKSQVTWFGEQKSSAWSLSRSTQSLEGTKGTLHVADLTQTIHTPLLGSHFLTNMLAGLALVSHFGGNLETAVHSLSFHPPIARRLEVHHNSNGSIVVDNSYNTNPATWKEVKSLLRQLAIPKLTLITAGFVELDLETTITAHHQLARDLAELCQVVGIIQTRFNTEFITALKAEKHLSVVTGYSQAEVLAEIAALHQKSDVLWLEGGVRELYQ